MRYTISFKGSARKEAVGLPQDVRTSVGDFIEGLRDDPRPLGCTMLQGKLRGYYRGRVGAYRIVYAVDDAAHEVTIVRVAPRGRVYR
ncbi:type II toxin-antitoxin system RelE/ParE family toxin [bacterium]|nr:type II toxin-antitoxin system RelE/ParE family toxin [bacterium]